VFPQWPLLSPIDLPTDWYHYVPSMSALIARYSLGKWSPEIAHDISEIEERSNSGNQRAGRPFVCLVLRECREHERLFMPDASQEGHE
jgi:hypothetical protein